MKTDFIVSFPKTNKGLDIIINWTDRLSRRVNLIPCKSSDTSVDVAQEFFTHMFKPHGMPDNIVSDRYPKFTTKFWDLSMNLCGVKLKVSSSRHPQTDAAYEVMNRMLDNYLRCYRSHHQDELDDLLLSAKFAYNSSISDNFGMYPFEVDLGYVPRTPLQMTSGK